MTILLFGVSNVGKTTIGNLLAKKLGYKFYDLDEEVKQYYHTTLEDFVNVGTIESRDWKRGIVLNKIMGEEADKVIAVTPISYFERFTKYLCKHDIFVIELRDTAKNIFDRLVFSDENDNVYEDIDYKNAHKKHYITEIKEDIEWYGRIYTSIENKFDINNDTPDIAVQRLIKKFDLSTEDV